MTLYDGLAALDRDLGWDCAVYLLLSRMRLVGELEPKFVQARPVVDARGAWAPVWRQRSRRVRPPRACEPEDHEDHVLMEGEVVGEDDGTMSPRGESEGSDVAEDDDGSQGDGQDMSSKSFRGVTETCATKMGLDLRAGLPEREILSHGAWSACLCVCV